MVQELAADLDVDSRTEFDHYGSGYASFVDAWFFRRDSSFRRPGGRHEHFTGLAVLLCRLMPVYCLLEGEKTWSPSGSGSSYLPSFDNVDAFRTTAVRTLARQVEDWLEPRGYGRLEKADLGGYLPEGVVVPTIPEDAPFRDFDALFHWED